MLIGVALTFSPIDPISLLLWSAVINGILAPPLIIIVLVICNNTRVMADHRNGWVLNTLGTIAAILMTGAAAALVASWLGWIS
jgi:Mn2+/Fe2+ NRAMP family transporter